MLTYFENTGASIEEIQNSKLICLDSSGGGALPYIAWAFKISKDVLNGELERSDLTTDKFEDDFDAVLREMWDSRDYAKEKALINENCRVVGKKRFSDKDFADSSVFVSTKSKKLD